MPYTIRNTLVLLAVLLVVIVGGIGSNVKSRKKLEVLNKKYTKFIKLIEQLKRTTPELGNEKELIGGLEKLEKKALTTNKLIPREDNSRITYQYLLNISPYINFDFALMSNGVLDEIQYNEYAISGKTTTRSLYAFIYQIENQAQLYVIEALTIEGGSRTKEAKQNVVTFSFLLRAYYDPENGVELSDIKMKNLPVANIRYDFFYPRIHQPFKNEREEKLLNIDMAIMIGLTQEVVFLQKSNGIIKILSPGDRVAYGYLDYIDWKKQCAVFKINRTGITTKKVLYIKNNKGGT